MRAIVKLAALGAMVPLAACIPRPTKITTTWVAPNATLTPFKKTLVVFLSNDTDLRVRIEDRLARALPNAVASYRLVPSDRFSDVPAVRVDMSTQGFDGAVVMRLLGVDSRSGSPQPSTSTPAEDLVEYLRQGPRNALAPGRGETVITVETRVYSMASGPPLWVGRSESFNPVSLTELVDMIVDAASEEMRRQTRLF